jgi:hypothetical protein
MKRLFGPGIDPTKKVRRDGDKGMKGTGGKQRTGIIHLCQFQKSSTGVLDGDFNFGYYAADDYGFFQSAGSAL